MCISRRELSNEYLLAKIGVDTAENEPLEVWGKFNSLFIRLLKEGPLRFDAGLRAGLPSRGAEAAPGARAAANFTGLVLGCIEAKFCKKIYV